MRTTLKHIECKINTLNEITNNPKERFEKGHFYCDQAYGGHKLVQIVNDGGGVQEITYGYTTKKELIEKISMLIKGVQMGKELVK